MSYATLADVAARAGRLWQAFDATHEPTFDDVEQMLETYSGKVDALIDAHGFTVPVTDENAIEDLRDVVANGALIEALQAKFPGGQARVAAAEIIADKRADYKAAMDALSAGTFSALVLLGSSSASTTGASDFWSNHESYGRVGIGDGFTLNPLLEPTAHRGMRF